MCQKYLERKEGEKIKSQLKANIDACHKWVAAKGALSMTQAAEVCGGNRKMVSKLAKDSQDYLLYTFENKGDPTDNRLYFFDKNELRIVERCKTETSKTVSGIAKEEGIKPDTLKNWIKILGAEPTAPSCINKYDGIDEHIFKEIDTEEKAYWLGFILADGCMLTNTDGRHVFSIALGEKDREHLVKLARFIGVPEDKIDDIIKEGKGGAYDRNNITYRMRVGRKIFCENLINKGILPNKSCKETVYKNIPEELERHFLRGVIDGDGSISSSEGDYRVNLVG